MNFNASPRPGAPRPKPWVGDRGMMQIVSKWKITITRSSAPSLVIFISDRFLSNVLRKLADLELEVEPVSMSIVLVENPQQSGTLG
jgi:hypothetical protein